MRRLSTVKRLARYPLGVLLSVVLALVLRPMGVMTPIGKHCPTAAIQAVQDPATGLQRAPKLGESGFVQCQCAEKKSTENASISQAKLKFEPVPYTEGSRSTPITKRVLVVVRPPLAASEAEPSDALAFVPTPPPNSIKFSA